MKHLLRSPSNLKINKNNQLILANAYWVDAVAVEYISMVKSTHISKRDSASRLTVNSLRKKKKIPKRDYSMINAYVLSLIVDAEMK